MIYFDTMLTSADCVARLQKMRVMKAGPQWMMPSFYDNCMRGAIQARVCMRRVKHAGLIGRFYWVAGRYETTTDVFVMPQYTDKLDHSYERNQASYFQLMRQDPTLSGGLDFATVGSTQGFDMHCFSSFLAGSVKQKAKGALILRDHFKSNDWSDQTEETESPFPEIITFDAFEALQEPYHTQAANAFEQEISLDEFFVKEAQKSAETPSKRKTRVQPEEAEVDVKAPAKRRPRKQSRTRNGIAVVKNTRTNTPAAKTSSRKRVTA